MRRLSSVLSLAVIPALVLAGPEDHSRAAAYAKTRVVLVEFSARVTLEGLPGMSPEENERTFRAATTGVVVTREAQQLVLVSATALRGPSRTFEVLGASPKVTLLSAAVALEGGIRLGLRLVDTNPELGLALLRLDSPSSSLEAVTFVEGAAPALGESLLLEARAGRILDGAPMSLEARMAGEARRPRSLWILDPAKPEAEGALVLKAGADGAPQVLGLHASLPLTELPGGPGKIGRRVLEADELQAAARGYVIPAGTIAAWIARARIKDEVAAALPRPKRAWLGIEVQVITSELAAALDIDYEGVAKVTKIYEGTPAAQAGLALGDIIIELDGEDLDMAEDETFRDLVGDLGVDTEVELSVLREGKRKKISAKLAASPTTPAEAAAYLAFAHGFVLREPTGFDAPGIKGLIVSKVEARGTALLAGLKEGDVVISINGEAVSTAGQAGTLIRPDASVSLEVLRGSEKPQSLKIEPKSS